ncbi:hypothetical protein FKP32DRAFT_1729673 [Trametes sanguinea]|nr:hypothetical protein FKP32DRAFT_1729673 [Trametes sanguinea]
MGRPPANTKVYDPSTLLPKYPEQNPFHLVPPPFNLTPGPDISAQSDTEELREAALAIAKSTGFNPLAATYGTHPLLLRNDNHVKDSKLPFRAYCRPKPLNEITLPEDVVFLKQIWHVAKKTALFIVRVAGEIRLLKVWPERQTSRVPDISAIEKLGDVNVYVDLDAFEQELDGYAHLQHYGVVEKGIVPRCYGWLTLSPAHIAHILKLPTLSRAAKSMEHAQEPPRAILLEYIADAQLLTADNVTDELADITLRGLAEIHSAYVMHCDVNSRNILVAPGNRVVWVDFNCSCTPASPHYYDRELLQRELALCWSFLYYGLLPDKRVGLHMEGPPSTDAEDSESPSVWSSDHSE